MGRIEAIIPELGNIYKSAQIIKNKHNGRFQDPIFIESLPGIGPYTKAAICSISLNLNFAVLDGKRTRVFLGKIFLY